MMNRHTDRTIRVEQARGSKGYTLLFAVVVSVLVLSIAAFILSVSRKQAILVSSARDSVYALYAADSGLECAVEHLADLAQVTPASSIGCGVHSWGVVPSPGNTDTVGTSTFFMLNGEGNVDSQTQSGISSCASTTVSYSTVYPDGGSVTATTTTVVVEARGYNIGWKEISDTGTVVTGDCSIAGPRKVERALRYVQYQ